MKALNKTWLAIAVLLGCVLVTFVDHLTGVVTYIGDADRLNAFLNFKLDELRSFSSSGQAPNWNWLNLGGFNFGAAYWMYPGFNPDTLVYSLLPESWFYYVAGVVAAALFFAATYGAFLLLRNICGHTFASIVGSCAYAYSAFSLTRIGQGDSAFLTLALAPWALLAVRRLGQQDGALPALASLTIAMAAMLWLTFLQEVAYVFMLLGAYAVFRSGVQRRLSPFALFIAAAFIATLLAFPRIATVADDFSLFSRLRFIQGTNPIEILRMLSDGIFGRHPEEIALIGNRGFNIHEGLRIFSSSAATVMVVVALWLLPARKGAGLVLMLAAAICAVLRGVIEGQSLFFGLFAFFVFYAAWHGRFRKDTATRLHSGDLPELWFAAVTVGVVMVVILNPKAGELFHKLFFGVSFIHSRLTIAALMPFSIVVALCLKLVLPAEDEMQYSALGWLLKVSGAAIVSVILVLVVSPGLEAMLMTQHSNPWTLHWMRVNPHQVFHVLLTAILVIGIIATARRTHGSRVVREMASLVLCAFIVVQTVQFGRMKLFGEHTRTGDAPFQFGNYFNPPAGDIRVPAHEQIAALRACTQNEAYRSILLADASKFPEQPAAHMSHLWSLRLMDGYPVMYASVASLPWPVESISLRSLRFGHEAEIPWRLLAALNVKYAIRLDADLYFGRKFSGAHPAQPTGCSDFLIENPVPPLPRQFFAGSVSSKGEGLPPVAGLTATLSSPGWVKVAWWLRWTSATVIVETREVGQEAFLEAANIRMPEAAAGVALGGLLPGRSYDIRLRHVAYDTQAEYISPPLRVDVPENPRPVPALVRAYRTAESGLAVEWAATGDPGDVEVQVQAGILGEFKVLGTVPEPAGRAVFPQAAAGDSLRVRLQKRDRHPYSLHSSIIGVSGDSGYAGDLALLQLGEDLRKASAVQGPASHENFSVAGSIKARYLPDRMEFAFAPLQQPRFIVINETFHPRWQAQSSEGPVEIHRANGSMIGLRIAPGVDRLELRFVPLIGHLWVWLFPLVGLVLAAGGTLWLKRRGPQSRTNTGRGVGDK